MGVVRFPNLMITPKRILEKSSCSRGCRICKDNLDYSIPLNLDPKQEFYTNLKKFFRVNVVKFDEISFLYYGDFFSHFKQVKTGIENLYAHGIIKKESGVSVWVRAEKNINKESLIYIKKWKNRGEFRLKFSISLDSEFHNFKKTIKKFYKTISVLEKIKIDEHSTILLQCNNIEFCKFSLKEKIELHKILQELKKKFKPLEINFSDFNVNIELDSNFKIDFFTFQNYKECIYMDKKIVRNSLEENLVNADNIYIEHADIFTDAISIHNPYCKKLKSNNFGSLDDSTTSINKKIRDFINCQKKISSLYKINNNGLTRCEYCIGKYDSIKEKM